MIKVRRDCVETNSSSTHAMIIASEETEPFFDVKFNIDEFGWGFRVLTDIDEKASYLYTAACEVRGYDVFDEFADMLRPYGVRCFSHLRANFKKYDEYNCLDVNITMKDPNKPAGGAEEYNWSSSIYMPYYNGSDEYWVPTIEN